MPLQRTRLLPTARSALSFNGVNQYAVVPHSDSLYLTGDFTVMLWASLKEPYDRWRGIVDKGRNPVSDFWFLTISGAYGMSFGIGFTDGTFLDRAFPPVNLNEWHMYCGGVESSSMFISMNGERKLYFSFTKQRMIRTLPIAIGSRSVATSFAAVRVAQLLIYRRALTNEEILWNYYYPDNPVRNGLVLWLHYDTIDTANNRWYDKSGFGNHATLYNNPVKEDIALPIKRSLSPTRTLSPVR